MRLASRIVWTALALMPCAAPAAAPQHNLILFVPDGLRAQIVDAAAAPAMAALRDEGVNFRNSHALFPTFTTANASALATGHGLGDTGDFSNYLYSGFRVTSANATVTPFLESDPVLRQVNDYYGGNYLNEVSFVAAARERGYATAAIGKLGPAAIFDLGALRTGATLIVDDSTGSAGQEVPLSEEWRAAFAKYRMAPAAPGRGDNGVSGTSIPNLTQQQFFLEVVIKVVLPHFKESGRPFVLVFWSRDPDGTQHNQGDSSDTLSPGINGATSLSAVRNADTALAAIEQALKSLQLFATTDLVVAADHGFSTISKMGGASTSLKPQAPYRDVRPGELPWGFLAIDLFTTLKKSDARLKLFDPDDAYAEIDWNAGSHPHGNAVIGEDADHPRVVIAANGGSDLIYLPQERPVWGKHLNPRPSAAAAAAAQSKLAATIVSILLEQDYVSGIFVDESRFGVLRGALGTAAIGVGGGRALTPRPAIVVNFVSSVIRECGRTEPALCAAEISDTVLQQGQGMHGSFSRADTWNFMAARGPDFRTRFLDPLPASNADIGATIARILGLEISPKGSLTGRVLSEALSGTPPTQPLAAVESRIIRSEPDPKHNLRTVLNTQIVDGHVYLDAAGFPGRTVGLDDSAH
jgi:type I phosphodiesterase/nucleotide pyrophosphatase